MDLRYAMVTCRKCLVYYRCTPLNDYYSATNTTDGQCETCLVAEMGVDGILIKIPKELDG